MLKLEILTGLLIAGLLLSLNCQKGGAKVIMQEVGFSMTLPTGWQIDSNDPNSYYEQTKQEDNWGMVIYYELEPDLTLKQYVENSIKEMEKMESIQMKMTKMLGEAASAEGDSEEIPQTHIVSKTARKINNLDAIEVIEQAAFKVIRVYISKDSKVIDVMFRTLSEDFAKSEPLFRKAIESIKIK